MSWSIPTTTNPLYATPSIQRSVYVPNDMNTIMSGQQMQGLSSMATGNPIGMIQAKAAQTAAQIAATVELGGQVYGAAQDIKDLKNQNVGAMFAATPNDENFIADPGQYQNQFNPYTKGRGIETGMRNATQFGGTAAKIGAAAGGPTGALLYGAAGTLGGLATGLVAGKENARKRAEFNRIQEQKKREWDMMRERYFGGVLENNQMAAIDDYNQRRMSSISPFGSTIYSM